MRVRRIWVIYSSILMLCLPSLQIEQLQWNGLHIWTQHWLWLSTSLASIRSLCACWWHHWCSVSRLSSSPLANSPPSGTPQVLISFRSFAPCFPGLDTQNRRWIPLSCLKKKKKKKKGSKPLLKPLFICLHLGGAWICSSQDQLKPLGWSRLRLLFLCLWYLLHRALYCPWCLPHPMSNSERNLAHLRFHLMTNGEMIQLYGSFLKAGWLLLCSS